MKHLRLTNMSNDHIKVVAGARCQLYRTRYCVHTHIYFETEATKELKNDVQTGSFKRSFALLAQNEAFQLNALVAALKVLHHLVGEKRRRDRHRAPAKLTEIEETRRDIPGIH